MIRRLITDRDVSLGLVVSPIVLDAETLLTPAARDRAAVLGVVVVERDGSTVGAPDATPRAYPFAGRATPGPAAGCARAVGAPPAATTPSCARCGRTTCQGGCEGSAGCPVTSVARGLADGLYLVRVQGGRATSVLPAAGPGTSAAR